MNDLITNFFASYVPSRVGDAVVRFRCKSRSCYGLLLGSGFQRGLFLLPDNGREMCLGQLGNHAMKNVGLSPW